MSCYSRAKLNLVRRDFSTAFETGLRQLNTCFQFVRTFAPEILVQIFAYLISVNFEIAVKYLPEFGYPWRKKWFSGTTTSSGSRETCLESLLKVLAGK